jgi:hypothetical protein
MAYGHISKRGVFDTLPIIGWVLSANVILFIVLKVQIQNLYKNELRIDSPTLETLHPNSPTFASEGNKGRKMIIQPETREEQQW